MANIEVVFAGPTTTFFAPAEVRLIPSLEEEAGRLADVVGAISLRGRQVLLGGEPDLLPLTTSAPSPASTVPSTAVDGVILSM
jgi:hypothetical protein